MTYTIESITDLLNSSDISIAYRHILLNQLRFLSESAYFEYQRRG